MHETVKALFTDMEASLDKTPIPADRKRLISAAVSKLANLYKRYRETNESRYGDEMTRQVQFIVGELEACREAHQLSLDFRKGLQGLHAELGIPPLSLKAPKALKAVKPVKAVKAPAKPRKAPKA